jgi:RNA polymerase sigma-70 factor (ECF subfamily)
VTRTDAELIAAAGGDASAFAELYDRHARRLHDFFVRRTADRDAALELTAETFAQAWYSRRRFEDRRGGDAAPWLFGIARHVLLRSIRARRVAQDAVERLGIVLELDRPAAPPEARWLDGLDDDIEDAIAAALADLPAGQRRAVQLRIDADLPYDAVAAELGCSPTAARIRVSRGLGSLRARLRGET